ncbi:hypothetical protein ABGV42_00755 [Paenibacillus pabuli]|uniref:hypothetical protein n=1 Tax=Paenibacillus pabuli TaxID=1472 RepID=UPI0032423DF0
MDDSFIKEQLARILLENPEIMQDAIARMLSQGEIEIDIFKYTSYDSDVIKLDISVGNQQVFTKQYAI